MRWILSIGEKLTHKQCRKMSDALLGISPVVVKVEGDEVIFESIEEQQEGESDEE